MRKMANFQIIVFVVISVSCFCHISHVAASTEYNRYLAHIFQKYGNGGTMTFEGLEHLMYSLGLGQIEFDDMHTIDEHRPKDFKINPSTNELDLMKSIKILPDDENDVQVIENIINENNKTIANNNNTASAASNDNEKESDDSNSNSNQINKNINNEFKEMHDPKHRHPRQNDATFDGPPLSGNVCLSPKSLLRLVVDHDDLHKRNLYRTSSTQTHSIKQQMDTHDDEEEYNEFINNVRLTPMAFMKLCPALLAQIDQQVCMQQAPHRHMEDPQTMIWNAWIYASASIFILSACGLLGILLVPLMKTVAYQEILNFLIAVAVGTLSGDALMHLLPHALVNEHAAGGSEEHSHEKESNGHTHDNTAVWICACAFFTALFMYIIENLLPLLKGSGGEEHSHHGHSHQHHHHHQHDQQSSEQKVPKQQQNEPNALESAATASPAMRELNIMLNETKLDKKKPSRPLTPVAFMVVIGDGLHNLTDGLAIGAAFAADPVTGLATAFAVLCHELPHELGDFALLLQTGVSIKRAICLNIVSSVLSFLGMAIGLLIANLHTNMTQWIYAGTAGSFLYIAFADLVPAMSAESRNKPKTAIIQILGIITGGLIMLAIAVNEDDLEKLFK